MTYENENKLCEGYNIVCGVDEAGRGPLAGPVYAAAVILPKSLVIDELNDSKKISEKKRDYLFEKIKESALCYGIARAEVEEIEKYNILNCAMLAMKRAIDSLDIKPELALIDGNMERGFDIDTKCVIKGDALCPSIAAASILAKVSRDRYCLEMDELYPQYGFAAHKGYGTKAHYEAIKNHGPCALHRMSFLKKLYL